MDDFTAPKVVPVTERERATTSAQPSPNVTATRRYDPGSRITWLEFYARPDDETRAALKANGWRWSGYRKEWYNNRRWPTLPPRVTTEEGGECDYSAERADRLTERAEKHATAASAAYQRSHEAVAMIPLGQPVLVGHHSERGHRAALDRSHRAMSKSVEESKTADRLQRAAESSRSHQAHTETPEAMQRRCDRLSADLRKMQRAHAEHMARLRQRGETPTAQDDEYAGRIGAVAGEVADLQQRIAEAGGVAADRLQAQAGDIVTIHGFTGRVVRVNPKTYTVQLSQDGWTLKLDRTWLQAIVLRAKPNPAQDPAQEPAS